jgi:hypothetical protein
MLFLGRAVAFIQNTQSPSAQVEDTSERSFFFVLIPFASVFLFGYSFCTDSYEYHSLGSCATKLVDGGRARDALLCTVSAAPRHSSNFLRSPCRLKESKNIFRFLANVEKRKETVEKAID